MDIRAFVLGYTEQDAEKIAFAWNGKHEDDFSDRNYAFRTEVLEYFEKTPSDFTVELVRDLFEAETRLAEEIWGVNPIVSDLSKKLLEDGRETYLRDWLEGLYRGMDAYCQSVAIDLDRQVSKDLLEYCREHRNSDLFDSPDDADPVMEFFEKQCNRE